MYDRHPLVLLERWPTGPLGTTSVRPVDPDRRRHRSHRGRARLGLLLLQLGSRLVEAPEQPSRPRSPTGALRPGRP